MLSQYSLQRSLALSLILAPISMVARPESIRAQGYVAAIAYSQSTGKIGHTAAQVRTEQAAKSLALRNCGAPDAKVWMWAQNEWVAIAVAEGQVGTAGFAHSRSEEDAQRKALLECRKRSAGRPCRVALCIHSQGARARTLLSIAGDPNVPSPAPGANTSGFYAAIAYSPSTGKIGYTAGEARTKEAAEQLALKKTGARDAKVFMWGNQWVAIAVVEGRTGAAGFGPGATREVAEQAALAQARKYAHGAPVRIALSLHSAGKQGVTAAKPATPAAATPAQPAETPTATPAARNATSETTGPVLLSPTANP
jgi:hypothetical protein